MPFTTSHPAIIIPLKRIWPDYFSLTGLIAGAMSPDFIFFLMFRTSDRGFSHSWSGLFYFCLPAGLLFCFVFHWLFKKEFIGHLPEFLFKKLSWLVATKWQPTGLREWTVLVSSVLVGALSHFFWDSWTHGAGTTTKAFPWLLTWVPFPGSGKRVFELLHHASSIGGVYFVIRILLGGPVNSMVNLTGRATVPLGINLKTTRQILLFHAGGLLAAIGMVAVAFTVHSKYPWPELISLSSYRFLFVTGGLASWTGYITYVCVCGAISLMTRKRRSIFPES